MAIFCLFGRNFQGGIRGPWILFFKNKTLSEGHKNKPCVFDFRAPLDPTCFATGFQWHARPFPAGDVNDDAGNDAFEGFRHLGRGAPRCHRYEASNGLVGVFFNTDG